jgi:hypothetical protein
MPMLRDCFRSIRILLVAVILALSAGCHLEASATDSETIYNNIVLIHGLELGSGGRAVALGGAYRALSDDLSGLYWNPAGLASIRRIEFGLGLTEGVTFDQTQIGLNPVDNHFSRTRLNEIGVVLPVPTFRGSLVFALGYHQVHTFDAYGIFRSTNDVTDFQADEMETGRLGLWSFGGAIDVSPTASFGLGLRLWTGYDDYSYASSDVSKANPATYFNLTEHINSDLAGFNLLGGVMLKPLPWLRVAGTLETPVKFRIRETGSFATDSSTNGQIAHDEASSNYTYHISRPWRLGVGTAVLIKRFGISADAGLSDWSQVSFTDDTPVSYLTRDQANTMITRKMRTTLDWHLGLEYWLPFANARLQAGYSYAPTPFISTEVLQSKNIISGGFSLLVDPSFQVQGTTAYALWDRSLGGWNEKLRLAQFMLTLSYRI